MKKPWHDPLIYECDDLQTKFDVLDDFLRSEAFEDLNDEDQQLLLKQFHSMNEHLKVMYEQCAHL